MMRGCRGKKVRRVRGTAAAVCIDGGFVFFALGRTGGVQVQVLTLL